MEILITKGENKRVVIPLFVNNAPYSVTNATEIICTLKIGSYTYKYTFAGSIANSGVLTTAVSMVGNPPALESLFNHEIALYIEHTQSVGFPVGLISAEIEVFYPDPLFPTNGGKEIICLTPGRVIDHC